MRTNRTAIWLCIGLLVWACESKKESDARYAELDQRTRIRLRQYMAEGKRLYTLHCSNCHMEDGTGLAALYPPLKHSDYMLDNFQEVVCGMRHGQQGPIVVNGLEYNQPMPGNPRLTDLELAEITTYIYNEFADSLLIISMHDVRKLMESCGGDEKIGAVPD